ncbi:MAG: hypothetical protein GPOALKHO_000152 [Sodalis sp.]|nr:MAG: hypothetical protein GPOALKHO_000152 [Sodalis sp.]
MSCAAHISRHSFGIVCAIVTACMWCTEANTETHGMEFIGRLADNPLWSHAFRRVSQPDGAV